MFCLPQDVVNNLRPRMKALGGAKLVSMSREELSVFFAESVGNNLANEVANSFRNAVVSSRKGAMKQWAKKVLIPEEAKAVAKIAERMTYEDELYENMDADVIEQALGVDITPEEVETINKLVENMLTASKKTPDNEFSGYHSDYFKAQSELNSFLDTANPMSNMSVLSRVIFRGNLLFAPKSIITNIVGNTTGGISEKVANSILERKATGVNSDLVKPYAEYALKTYRETGIDVVRAMEAHSHQSILGEHFQGVGEGSGVIRVYGRFVEQYVLRLGQGAPDIVFASMHFADNVNVQSTKIADAKGMTGEAKKQEARRLFHLATSLTLDPKNPTHAEALVIKQVAVQYALTATYQNDNAWSKNALAIRNTVDEYTGDLALGTNLTPFVKTLVNIAKLSIDMTGVTLPIELPRLAVAIKNGDEKSIRLATNIVIRAGLGITLAMILASMLDDDDYLPDYTIASNYQKEIAKLANAPYNSIRIGDKWVSLAYFGTFGYALAGMLGARQKTNTTDKVMSYYKNTLLQLRQTPIIQQVLDMYDYIGDANKYKKNGKELGEEAIAYVANFFSSRIIPAIVGDIAKGIDDKERFTRYGFEGMTDQLQQKIPFWREVLPPKYNALGDTIATESWYWILLAGSRFKTAPKDTVVYKELVNLSLSGEEVHIKVNNFQDVKLAKELLTPKEYNDLTGLLQGELSDSYANVMSTEKYKNETDPEKKKKYLMDVRDNVVRKVLRSQGYYNEIRDLKRRKHLKE